MKQSNPINNVTNNTKDTKRPFFSIIIPCYNSKPEHIQALLTSIEKQNLNDEIEIIISNDRSTDTQFLDKVKDFSDLNITIVDVPDSEDYIHCPGNTREIGVSKATGEWITFVDHDDELIANTFKEIKDTILKENIQYVASCNFYEVDPYNNDQILNEFVHTGNWMHAKFYNLDNFWKAKDFHFKHNMKTHEDIYISSKTKCELNRLGLSYPDFIEIFCLKWNAWKDSTSRDLSTKESFLEKYFSDYIESTLGYYIDDYIYSVNELKDDSDENILSHVRSCIEVIMYMYFYIQGFRYKHPLNYILENEIIAKKYIRAVCEVFSCDVAFIYACALSDNGHWYNAVRQSANIGVGQFVESYTFYDFLI